MLRQVFDKPEEVKDKVGVLAELITKHKGSCVVHVGAGISTAAGIRDFRGRNGVWTELVKSRNQPDSVAQLDIKRDVDSSQAFPVKPFDEAIPTTCHLALKTLCENGYIRHIVSQNVDGLFLKSNLNRRYISELHGNFFLDECTRCRSRFIRSHPSKTMRLQRSSIRCPRATHTSCKGYLRDTILDWESPIPFNELRVATKESKRCLLHICMGTSLQLKPSKDLVRKPTKTNKVNLVTVNLQPTMFDKDSNLVIHYYVNDVMVELMKRLNLAPDEYSATADPTKNSALIGTIWSK